jgi:hypothetical protein
MMARRGDEGSTNTFPNNFICLLVEIEAIAYIAVVTTQPDGSSELWIT